MCSPGFGGVGTGGDRKLKREVLVVAKKTMKPRSSLKSRVRITLRLRPPEAARKTGETLTLRLKPFHRQG
jgi:hypothetical protein